MSIKEPDQPVHNSIVKSRVAEPPARRISPSTLAWLNPEWASSAIRQPFLEGHAEHEVGGNLSTHTRQRVLLGACKRWLDG